VELEVGSALKDLKAIEEELEDGEGPRCERKHVRGVCCLQHDVEGGKHSGLNADSDPRGCCAHCKGCLLIGVVAHEGAVPSRQSHAAPFHQHGRQLSIKVTFPVTVAGSQWGDEGKGKIVDWLSERADVQHRRATLPGQVRRRSAQGCA
jgi:hypothetical protein